MQRPPVLPNTNVLMLYLLAVLFVATRYSRGAAVFASLLGVAAFDVCFVPPYLSLIVAERRDVVTFAVMLFTAVVISTLTHRARAHSQAARSAWERAESESLRNTLLSGVSHDLRTPLAAITGAASALETSGDTLPAAARAELVETIAEESDRMERLVNNLLDITRVESGGLVLRKEWLPPAELVGAALHHLDRRLRGRDVTTDLPPDLPLVYVDAVAVEQILVNLLDNALEYAPAPSPIAVSGRAGAGGVVLEVADRGPGLPAGSERRVFEKFYRGDRHHPAPGPHGARTGRCRGAGLGLAICRGIVEAHGGTIAAANRPGGGAAFTVTFPRGAAPPAVDATQ